jgi:hypothetical protein
MLLTSIYGNNGTAHNGVSFCHLSVNPSQIAFTNAVPEPEALCLMWRYIRSLKQEFALPNTFAIRINARKFFIASRIIILTSRSTSRHFAATLSNDISEPTGA